MRKDLLSLITIDSDSAVPVYRQIVDSIRRSIDHGHLGLKDPLPSVNGIAEHFRLARGSVFSAYNELRASGLIDSVPGKGYFITSTSAKQVQKLFLLLDDFTSERAEIYKCIRQILPAGTELCVFFHHNDPDLFKTLIREKASYHNAFVIIPTKSIVATNPGTADSKYKDRNTSKAEIKDSQTTNSQTTDLQTTNSQTTDLQITDLLSGLDQKKLLILGGDFSGYKPALNGWHPALANNMTELPALLSKKFL